jgi:hypothetical protein
MSTTHGIGYLVILVVAFLLGLAGTVAASEALRASLARPPAVQQPAKNTKVRLPVAPAFERAYPMPVEC